MSYIGPRSRLHASQPKCSLMKSYKNDHILQNGRKSNFQLVDDKHVNKD